MEGTGNDIDGNVSGMVRVDPIILVSVGFNFFEKLYRDKLGENKPDDDEDDLNDGWNDDEDEDKVEPKEDEAEKIDDESFKGI